MECFSGNNHHLLCLILKTSFCSNTLLPLVKIWQEFLKPLKDCKHYNHRSLKPNTIMSTYTHNSLHFTSFFDTTYLYVEIIYKTIWVMENTKSSEHVRIFNLSTRHKLYLLLQSLSYRSCMCLQEIFFSLHCIT